MTEIVGTTRLLGVIGDPVEHSLSPVMHNAALAALSAGSNLDFVYLPLLVPPDQLAIALAGFAAIRLHGFNVTIPHKQAIMPLLQQLTPLAQAVGAVNTVWATSEGWVGTNTDVAGFMAPLYQQSWAGTRAVILGNGGAARAVVVGCAKLGCADIWVVGRDRTRLQQFQQSWQESPLSVTVQVTTWDNLSELLPDTTLVVNTTPIGMFPQVNVSPLDEPNISLLPATAVVYDLIYNPRPTQLLQWAQSRNLTTIDGLEMLVQQGAAALEQWIKRQVPVDIMRRAALQHLAH